MSAIFFSERISGVLFRRWKRRLPASEGGRRPCGGEAFSDGGRLSAGWRILSSSSYCCRYNIWLHFACAIQFSLLWIAHYHKLQSVHRHPWPLTSHRIRNNSHFTKLIHVCPCSESMLHPGYQLHTRQGKEERSRLTIYSRAGGAFYFLNESQCDESSFTWTVETKVIWGLRVNVPEGILITCTYFTDIEYHLATCMTNATQKNKSPLNY